MDQNLEITEFEARDGFKLILNHVVGSGNGHKGPILLVHGGEYVPIFSIHRQVKT